jgi:hypothetical protein
MTRAAEKYDRGLFELCVGVDSAFIRGYARPLMVFGNWGDSMRFVAAIGLAALAAGCAPKLELADGNSYARQAATRLAQGPDEIEAAASPAQTAKPAVRNARSSPFRVQTVSAHYQGNADAQNTLAVPALGGQPNIAAPAATVASPGTTQRDGDVATQPAGVGTADRTPPGQALDPAQETAPSPVRETAPSPAREPVPGPAREAALSPAREIALSPARETALSPARETALSPARETALSPARETALSPVRETALGPARGIALAPARETPLNDGFLQASACIRNNLKAAYRSSDTVDQATSFLMRTCFAPFSSAIASDEASAKTLFRGLVFQEISPVEWLQALEESASRSR